MCLPALKPPVYRVWPDRFTSCYEIDIKTVLFWATIMCKHVSNNRRLRGICYLGTVSMQGFTSCYAYIRIKSRDAMETISEATQSDKLGCSL